MRRSSGRLTDQSISVLAVSLVPHASAHHHHHHHHMYACMYVRTYVYVYVYKWLRLKPFWLKCRMPLRPPETYPSTGLLSLEVYPSVQDEGQWRRVMYRYKS